MISKSLRDILEEETVKTESAIRKILQEFHDATGMIPRSIDINDIDVRENASSGARVIISSVRLSATT